MTEIIGLCVIQNEDIHIRYVFDNILDFCDKIIILDNLSTDGTLSICQSYVTRYPDKFVLKTIEDTRDTLSFIQEYVGKDYWLFVVDGDEIYDPSGLKQLKETLVAGSYSSYSEIRGYFLHVFDLKLSKKRAVGYMGPPSKEVTKLINLSVMKRWKADGVRTLIHPSPTYIDRYQARAKFLYRKKSWEDCILRCLHVRFLRRSFQEKDSSKKNLRYFGIRLNPSEKHSRKTKQKMREYKKMLNYREKFRVGEPVKVNVSSFFP